MTIGLFQAAPPDDKDDAFVEITKLRMDSTLTSLDLYSLDTRLRGAVPWGNRPNKGLVVDGLHGIVYYFVMNTGDAQMTYEPYTRGPCVLQCLPGEGPRRLACLVPMPLRVGIHADVPEVQADISPHPRQLPTSTGQIGARVPIGGDTQPGYPISTV